MTEFLTITKDFNVFYWLIMIPVKSNNLIVFLERKKYITSEWIDEIPKHVHASKGVISSVIKINCWILMMPFSGREWALPGFRDKREQSNRRLWNSRKTFTAKLIKTATKQQSKKYLRFPFQLSIIVSSELEEF